MNVLTLTLSCFCILSLTLQGALTSPLGNPEGPDGAHFTPMEAAVSEVDGDEIARRDEFSRILRGGPQSFSRILRGGPSTFSRILRGGQPQSFSRILRGGPNTFSRILRAYFDRKDKDDLKRESFSRILRSGFSRINKKSDEEVSTGEEDFARETREPGFSRIMRDPHFSRILRGDQEFSRIL